jgi:hypothetical protein
MIFSENFLSVEIFLDWKWAFKILCFVICVEDYHKLTPKHSFNPVPPWYSVVRVDKNVACSL